MSEEKHEKENLNTDSAATEVAPASPSDATIPLTQPAVSPAGGEEIAEREMRRLTRRSFLWAAVAGFGGIAAWSWLGTRRSEDGIPWTLRRVLEVNEQIAQDYYNASRLAPTFP